jgi:hypothetical protein
MSNHRTMRTATPGTPSRIPSTGRRYGKAMADTPELVTAAEMAEMTPNERAALVAERSSTDLESLSPTFRASVEARAHQLADELRAERTNS